MKTPIIQTNPTTTQLPFHYHSTMTKSMLAFHLSQPLPVSSLSLSVSTHLNHTISPTYIPGQHHDQRYSPYRSSRVLATATPTPSTTATPTNINNPQSPPSTYPPPKQFAAEASDMVRECQSIPAVMNALAQNPKTSSLTALVDEYHGDEKIRLTFAELRQRVTAIAAGLHKLSLSRSQVVSLFSENSHRWFLIDQAIMTLGAASAVRGVSAPVPELRYIYEHSESVAIVVEHASVLERLVAAGLDRSSIRFAVVLYGDATGAQALLPDVKVLSFTDLEALGKGTAPTDFLPVANRSELATLLYTSGTTGFPKGVVLTHGNILAQLEDISLGSIDPTPGEVFVSVLPCWHVFERTAEYWCLSLGVQLVYSNKRHFKDDLAKHRPHLLISVPRVFENLHTTIMSRLQSASSTRRALFAVFMAISLAFVKARRRIRGLDLNNTSSAFPPMKLLNILQMMLLMPLYALADKLIWSKIRANMGGRLRICLSGGGSIAGYLEDFFECAGVDICVGYGLTETSPVIANRFGEENMRGTTGMTLPRAYVKIVNRETGKPVKPREQGSLHIRGPYVFSNYLKNPEATAKVFDHEGYFNTGDLAYYTENGHIVISGRDKDVIVLSNGENIEPAPIEDAILASSLVDQIMLVGQDQRALSALVVPHLESLQIEGLIDDEFVERVEKLRQAPEENRAEISKLEIELGNRSDVSSIIKSELRNYNEERIGYSNNDRILNIRLILVPFSVENGQLTQTLKLKKKVVNQVYAEEIKSLF